MYLWVNDYLYLTKVMLKHVTFTEAIMERDRYMSPVEAQEFGILDKVLVHPPHDGEDEPELVQKEIPPIPTVSPSSAEPWGICSLV